ncbi:MAG: putative zinc-binding protein [Promethearchaeota archaeon]
MFKPMYVGVLSCSGEELPGGTVSRIATRQVLTKLLPGRTTTICVPLFLAGDQGERDFVKNFPCVTVDGCDKRCAAKSVEALGKKPAAEFVVPEFFEGDERAKIEGGPLHDLEWKDSPLCERLAVAVAKKAAEILGEGGD